MIPGDDRSLCFYQPDVLYGVYSTFPEDHVIFQCEDAHHPGTNPAVHFGELTTNYRVRVVLQVTYKSSWKWFSIRIKILLSMRSAPSNVASSSSSSLFSSACL